MTMYYFYNKKCPQAILIGHLLISDISDSSNNSTVTAISFVELQIIFKNNCKQKHHALTAAYFCLQEEE